RRDHHRVDDRAWGRNQGRSLWRRQEPASSGRRSRARRSLCPGGGPLVQRCEQEDRYDEEKDRSSTPRDQPPPSLAAARIESEFPLQYLGFVDPASLLKQSNCLDRLALRFLRLPSLTQGARQLPPGSRGGAGVANRFEQRGRFGECVAHRERLAASPIDPSDVQKRYRL